MISNPTGKHWSGQHNLRKIPEKRQANTLKGVSNMLMSFHIMTGPKGVYEKC